MTTQLSVQTATDFIQSATTNFTGQSPNGAMTVSARGFEWAADTQQGLIDPVQLGIHDPMRVIRVELFMAGQATWQVELVDRANSIILADGTTEASYSSLNPTLLMNGQKLKVTTTGAGTSSVKLIVTLANPNFYSNF